jgi:hypothetical protein
MGAARVPQHDLGHQFRPAIRRNRERRRVFVDRNGYRIAVDCGRGGKDEMADAAFDCGFDRRAGINGVVAIIAERLAHRIRRHDASGKMNDGVDIVLAKQPRKQRLLAAIADDEVRTFENGPAKSRGEIIEHHGAPASNSWTIWLPI